MNSSMYAKRSKFKIEEPSPKKVEIKQEEKTPTPDIMGLGDENVCLVCYDHSPDAVFMECGHGGNNHLHISYYFRYVL